MKKLNISQDKTAIVDDENFDRLNEFTWFYHSGGYAVRREKKKSIYLHHEILQPPPGHQIVFKDRDKLNCQKENLRVVTVEEARHFAGPRSNSTSEYKGVSKAKSSGKWKASIRIDGKETYLGLFDDETEAARTYDTMAWQHFGEGAYLNFPKEVNKSELFTADKKEVKKPDRRKKAPEKSSTDMKAVKKPAVKKAPEKSSTLKKMEKSPAAKKSAKKPSDLKEENPRSKKAVKKPTHAKKEGKQPSTDTKTAKNISDNTKESSAKVGGGEKATTKDVSSGKKESAAKSPAPPKKSEKSSAVKKAAGKST